MAEVTKTGRGLIHGALLDAYSTPYHSKVGDTAGVDVSRVRLSVGMGQDRCKAALLRTAARVFRDNNLFSPPKIALGPA